MSDSVGEILPEALILGELYNKFHRADLKIGSSVLSALAELPSSGGYRTELGFSVDLYTPTCRSVIPNYGSIWP